MEVGPAQACALKVVVHDLIKKRMKKKPETKAGLDKTERSE